MNPVHDVRRFRAAGVLVDWLDLVRPMLQHERAAEWISDDLLERLKERGQDLRLVWGCSSDLGVPREAFTVWVRRLTERWQLDGVEFQSFTLPEGELVWWGGEEAAHVEVDADVDDPSRPVALFLLRTGLDPLGAVGAAAANSTGGGSVTLRASAGAATHAVLVNARPRGVRVGTVSDVVSADDWEPLELVGLPVEGTELGDYSPAEQGFVRSPTPPVDAALQRLDRVGSPLGWWPVTESGRLAPPFVPTDPTGLVKETREFLLPELTDLYDPGRPERDQHLLETRRTVDPPSRADGKVVDQPATATVRPLAMLMLPAFSDASTNVVTGFGTGYDARDLPDHPAEVEFLVTARYRASVLGDDVEVAAYVPPVQRHAAVPPVVDLRADRAALLPPQIPDAAFRESVEVSWRPSPSLAVLTAPVVHALAGWRDGATEAEDLLPTRPGGGTQPRAIPRPEATTLPGADRPKVVHHEQELPVDGAVMRGYAVAQADIFGVWSPWEDVEHSTASPSVAPPRLVRLTLDASYAGTPVCPSSLTVDLAVDRTQRTAATVDVRAVLYPMPGGSTPPPAGATPDGPVPPGCVAVGSTVAFAGDVATAAPGVVLPLRDDGSVSPTWGAPEQGSRSRSYRLTLTGPGLDFGPVSRWGAQVWVRQTAPGIVAPSVWSPVPEHPATAVVASPVPAVPVPPPLPPGVPVGSTPDAQGCSHVTVAWTGLSSPHVDRVVVWEAAETTLRHRLAPGDPPDRRLPLGVRLQQLWDLYDGAPPDARPLAFRRAAEVPAGPGAADLTLPRGTEDIHLFLVTAVTTTGLESPWPAGTGTTPAHAHLQAAAAPRLRRPAMPLARPGVAADGSVSVSLAAASPIPVAAFEIFATRSDAAARDHLTMGPRHAAVAATPAVDPGTGTPLLDGITREPVWAASWAGSLPPSWEPWHLRAVAVPVPEVPVHAERGLVSEASDVVTLTVLPTAAPGLVDLVAEVRGADHRGLLVRTATTASARPVPAGSHTVQVNLAGVDGPRVPLESTSLVADDTTAPDTTAGPVVQRLARVEGSTPLLVWAHRADASVDVAVTVRVADPLGRQVERSVTVPGWVEPRPELTLEIVDVFRITGRGTVATLLTSADPAALPPHVLSVVATLGPGSGLVLPRPPFDGRGGPRLPLRRSLRASWQLPDIPTRRSPVPPRGTGITAVRSTGPQGTEIGLWIPSTQVSGLAVSLEHPTEGTVQRAWRAPR